METLQREILQFFSNLLPVQKDFLHFLWAARYFSIKNSNGINAGF